MSATPQVTSNIAPDERERRNAHSRHIVWLTGLSGAGKSTIAMALERQLFDEGRQVCVLDGDIVRTGLCQDLGFSVVDREENIRRIGEVAQIMSATGFVVIVAFISPFRADRDRVRKRMTNGRFTEVFVNAPLEVCEQRAPKDLSAPYEEPLSSEVEIPTGSLSVEDSVERVLAMLA